MGEIRVDNASSGWGETLGVEARYADLVVRLSRDAAANPTAYRRRVVAAGLLGYLVIGLTLALLIGALAFVVVMLFTVKGAAVLWLKLAMVAGLAAFGVLRALNLPRLVPEGRLLEQSAAPVLFEQIQAIRAATGGPRLDEVRLTDDLNAAVTQEPRIGPFGNISRLYIGLPLLRGLSPSEAEAVIAHEFGHFAGRHGHSTTFVYRVRMRWARLAQELPDGVVAGVLKRFFGWYAPWFAAYSFTLARRQEFDADETAARLAGPDAIGNALKRIEMQAARSGRIWHDVWSSAYTGADMPQAPSERVAAAFIDPAREGTEDGSADKALADAMSQSPGLDDTHPTLAQRLDALGQDAKAPAPLTESAASILLGDETTIALAAAFDSEWCALYGDDWSAMHANRLQQVEERKLLLDREEGALSRAELERLAELESDIDGHDGTIRGYNRLLARDPEDGIAAFRVGIALAALDRVEAAELLETAYRNEPTLGPMACQTAIELLDRLGEHNRADRIRAELPNAEARVAAAVEEDGTLNEHSQLEPLDEAERALVAETIAPVEGLVRASAVWRRRSISSRAQLVVLFKAKNGATGNLLADTLIDQLRPLGDVLVVEESLGRRWLAKRIAEMGQGRLVG